MSIGRRWLYQHYWSKNPAFIRLKYHSIGAAVKWGVTITGDLLVYTPNMLV